MRRHDTTNPFVGKPNHMALHLPPEHVRPHYTPDYPDSLESEEGKDPYNDQLTEPVHNHDPRLQQFKERAPVLVPDYNRLYGSNKTVDGWRYVIDAVVTGTTGTTSANASITKVVTFATPVKLELSKWPGAISAFFVLRWFSMAPQSAITTVGSVSVTFQDQTGGFTVPLGSFVSSGSLQEDRDVLIPIAITDPGITNIGTLSVTLTGTTPTTSNYDFQIGFSLAYLLPCLEGYTAESIHKVLNNGDHQSDNRVHERSHNIPHGKVYA